MELPNKAKAQIPLEKIKDYLLSEAHAVGKSKAKYFRSCGTKYILDGELETSNGVMMRVRTIWIIENDDDTPRFVTAYPNE